MQPAKLYTAQLSPLTPQPASKAVLRRPSLTADFFTRQQAIDKSRDDQLFAQRRRLQQALLMPSQHRWVADWLFVDSDDAFHRHIPVPPEAFDTTLAVQIDHQFTEIPISSKCPHPFKQSDILAKQRKCPVTGKTVTDISTYSSHKITTADLLLLPVANLDGITVGYAFGGGSYMTASGSVKPGPPFCGRFAFNAADEDLLMIINGKPPGMPTHFDPVTVIMTVAARPGEGKRQHTFFTCPKLEYDFENLPSQILSVVTAEGAAPVEAPEPLGSDMFGGLLAGQELEPITDSELLGAPVSEARIFKNPHSSTETDSSTLLFDTLCNEESALESEDTTVSDRGLEFVKSLFEDVQPAPASSTRSSKTYATPWEVGPFQGTRDGVGIPRVPGENSTSSGAFDMRALSNVLGSLSTALQGSYKATKKTGGADPLTGQIEEEQIFKVVATLQQADEAVTAKLQRQAAALYFMTTMTVRRDEGRLNHMIAVQVAPAQDGMGYKHAAALVCDRTAEMRQREERREAKKRRNRMSAARSNQRRKEANDLRKKTLASLKARVEELEERKKILTAENRALKSQMCMDSMINQMVV